MTRTSRVRFGAALLAIACLAVGVGGSGSASASPSAKAAKRAGNASCPPRTICLWSDHFSGTKRVYGCANKPKGSYHRRSLTRYFKVESRGGVSSYRNNGLEAYILTSPGRGLSGRLFFLRPNTNVTTRNNRELHAYDDMASEILVTC